MIYVQCVYEFDSIFECISCLKFNFYCIPMKSKAKKRTIRQHASSVRPNERTNERRNEKFSQKIKCDVFMTPYMFCVLLYYVCVCVIFTTFMLLFKWSPHNFFSVFKECPVSEWVKDNLWRKEIGISIKHI